ncbi:HNH endonuclease signature motif containing protein [Geodermatophilus nigrescens]|uniref:HNH endonuclease n=1 Tax=Geodermatophilus nigrescens TaxID=1070870 RepID=A0A1M5IRR8_9ACTN|nr:HNH endonuclease signature motif containing protein [Geodermatophilus nigrescens]SHG30936.1 HNH endonuclease [Geodermatophilus nigrescens]
MSAGGQYVSPIELALTAVLAEQPLTFRRLPVALLSREHKARELQRLAALKAQTAAYEAELVLGLADDSPDDDDPPPGTPGARSGSWAPDPELPGVSEFFTAELAVVLNVGRPTATTLAKRAWTYRESLPATWAALRAGQLDERRAMVLVDVLQWTAPALARRIEARLLPRAAEWTTRTLRKRAVQALLELDPDAAERKKDDATRTADVRIVPSAQDGMAVMIAELPAEVAAMCMEVVERLARLAVDAGDRRPIGVIRTEVFTALFLGAGDPSRPPVTAHLQIIATLSALAGRSAEPGEVNGIPITAAVLRELLRQLDALGVGVPDGGSVTLALTDDDGTLHATTPLDQARTLARRGCPDHPDGEANGGCQCPVLDRPEPTDRYTPTRPQQRFVRTRDRTCRFPTCGQRVGWADADHVIPHAHGGKTDCANLCCLCRSHHRLKTFARGWHFSMSPDGVLTVTTPSGITRTTRPPGMRPPPERDPPPGATGTLPPADPADDPPPF